MATKKSNSDFIQEATKLHKGLFDYSKVIYDGAKTPIIVICKTHGEFTTVPDKHLHTLGGCRKCRYNRAAESRCHSLEELISQAKTTHGNTYDYSKAKSCPKHSKTVFACATHGEFRQSWNVHILGGGCSQCSGTFSYGELSVIRVLDNLGISYVREATFDSLRNPATDYKLRFDFYLPKFNKVIEFHGAHHYKIDSFGVYTAAKLVDQQNRDKLKRDWCKTNNIGLLEIPMYQARYLIQLIHQFLQP